MTDLTQARLVGGMDISFLKGSDVDACVCLVVLDVVSHHVVYQVCKPIQLSLPYISGFLAFREAPFLLELLTTLRRSQPEFFPQVVLVDGNGVLHPRRCGLASHLGVLAGVPTVGVAKTLFLIDGIQKPSLDLLSATGSTVLLQGASGTIWGAALRTTADSINPVFVSIGHRVSLPVAVALCLRCSFVLGFFSTLFHANTCPWCSEISQFFFTPLHRLCQSHS